jgi:hypothetical protein
MSEPPAASPPCVISRDDAGVFLDARQPRIALRTSTYTRKNQKHRPRIRAARLSTRMMPLENDDMNTGEKRGGVEKHSERDAARPGTRRKTIEWSATSARTHRQRARKEPEIKHTYMQAQQKAGGHARKTTQAGRASQRRAARPSTRKGGTRRWTRGHEPAELTQVQLEELQCWWVGDGKRRRTAGAPRDSRGREPSRSPRALAVHPRSTHLVVRGYK